MADLRCFLCAKPNSVEPSDFQNIESCNVPASQKAIRIVLTHLATCIRTKLEFPTGSCVCLECFEVLSKYDSLMLNLLSFQRRLTRQLKTVIEAKTMQAHLGESEDMEILQIVDEVEEGEVFEFEEQEQLADAFNPELDAKEELIEVDDVCVAEEPVEVIDNTNSNGKSTGDCEVELGMPGGLETNDESDNSHSSQSVGRRRVKQECVVCGILFRTKQQLTCHLSEVHNTKVYACKICGAVRRDEEYLELHMNLHEGKTETECRYCPKRFSRPVNTLRHMRKHWDKKKYQCEKCGERFSLDNMLYNHRLRHEAEENPLICSICNQSFKSRKTYNHHIMIHQVNRPRHYCNLCPKSFTERYTLKVHMKTHADAKTSPPAAVHEESVETEAAITAIVEGEDKIKCIICSAEFESKETLDQHLQTSHDVVLSVS